MLIRDAADSDIPAIQSIYGYYVETSLATFEEVAPTCDEIRSRQKAITNSGLPYLVAVINGEIAGYAYASTYRPRPAYRFTVEDSVYIKDGMHGKGIGSKLLNALIERCVAGSYRQMIAVIGDSANHASIALHSRFGFRRVGVFESVGFKFGRWVDTVLMQKPLGH